ncbi:hypothetical protein Fmac_004572 [Flemingia macrophylla]|uniref:Uncharacterized protein n=1 Tax=Flemingia macrophylla TaxID=520843 RepID=A0ABD1N597_9FABA
MFLGTIDYAMYIFPPTHTKQKATTPSFLLLLLPPPLHQPPPHPHPGRQPPPPPHRRRRSGQAPLNERRRHGHPTPVPPPPPSSTLPPHPRPRHQPPPPPHRRHRRLSAGERSPTSRTPHPGSSSSSILHPSTILRPTPTPHQPPPPPFLQRHRGQLPAKQPPRQHRDHRLTPGRLCRSHRISVGPPPLRPIPLPSRSGTLPSSLGSQRCRDLRSGHQQPRLNASLLLLHHASAVAVGIPYSIPAVVALPLRFQVTFPSSMVFTWCFPWSHLTWSYAAEVDATNCIYYGPVDNVHFGAVKLNVNLHKCQRASVRAMSKGETCRKTSDEEDWKNSSFLTRQHWLKCIWVGKLTNLAAFDKVSDLRMMFGRDDLMLHYLGDDLVLLSGLNEVDLPNENEDHAAGFWSQFSELRNGSLLLQQTSD